MSDQTTLSDDASPAPAPDGGKGLGAATGFALRQPINKMSLDVYLEGETRDVECSCRECGHEHTKKETEQLYWANITHNLGEMAGEAGIYEVLWRPDEVGIEKAEQLIEPLRAGLQLLKSDPPRFEKHNSPNGWGLYEHFVPFVEKYLEACEANPSAKVNVSR